MTWYNYPLVTTCAVHTLLSISPTAKNTNVGVATFVWHYSRAWGPVVDCLRRFSGSFQTVHTFCCTCNSSLDLFTPLFFSVRRLLRCTNSVVFSIFLSFTTSCSSSESFLPFTIVFCLLILFLGPLYLQPPSTVLSFLADVTLPWRRNSIRPIFRHSAMTIALQWPPSAFRWWSSKDGTFHQQIQASGLPSCQPRTNGDNDWCSW